MSYDSLDTQTWSDDLSIPSVFGLLAGRKYAIL